MPQPGNKRLRSANYSNSKRHYLETPQLHSHNNRTPIWSNILKNRTELNRLQSGGEHTLGNTVAAKNGNISISSDDTKNKDLVLGDGKIIGTSQSFSIATTGVFELTLGTQGGTTNENIELTILPDIGAAKDMTQGELDAFVVNDIITISGFDNAVNAEGWINGTYRVTAIVQPAAVKTGIIVERLDVTHSALPLTGPRGPNTKPTAAGHSPVIKKHFRISIFDAAGAAPTFYV